MLMIFFDKDSILLMILLMVLKMIHEDRNVATTPKVNFGQVISQLPPTIRRIESLSKIINAEAVISFNNIYIL
jgi:hypothetical protein